MFHRRVLLLFTVCGAALFLLIVRLGWMTLGESGVIAREQAAKRLVTETWLPAVRGRIYDRKGRLLAGDRASYDIALDYRVLDGQWVWTDRVGRSWGTSIERYARRLASRTVGEQWGKLSEKQKQDVVDTFEQAMRSRIDEMYQSISDQTGMSLEDIYARRDEIVSVVTRAKESYTRRTRERLLNEYATRGATPTPMDLDRIEQIASQSIREEVQAHIIVPDVTDEIGFSFIRQESLKSHLVGDIEVAGEVYESPLVASESLFPGLNVLDGTTRLYPYQEIGVGIDRSTFPPPLRADRVESMRVRDVGSMILGEVRVGIQAEDSQRRAEAISQDESLAQRSLTEKGTDRGRYFPNDLVGRSGLERVHEHSLRGLRGVTVTNLQSGETTEIQSTPGQNVVLTIDIMLQARIRAILDPKLGLARVQPWHANEEETMPVGTELDAGVVVLEVASGEILALVSTPVVPRDGDWSIYGVKNDRDRRLFETIHTPYVNRAVSMPYPPGSVAKALILAGAAKYGEYTQGERIEATGHLFENQPNRYRSWIWKQTPGLTHFHQLERHPDGVDALMVSSNVFFFTLGRRLGPDRVSDVYRLFRVERPYELGLGGEWAGSIEPFNGERLNIEHATLMGIGQGPVTWTPLHAADSYATLARQGYRIKPKLISDGRSPSVTDIGLPSWAVRDALDGLRAVVSNRRNGSGFGIRYGDDVNHTPTFDAPGIQVWGKTGTAEAPAIVFDPDRVGDENGPLEPFLVRDGDHSWFVTLVGQEGGNPEYAIAVVVDYAGSGGRVSGPINNQIVYALIEEGYLPDFRPSSQQGWSGEQVGRNE